MPEQYSAQEIVTVISSALVKIGKSELDLAIGRLKLAIRMIEELQKQKSFNRST